jgi:xylan 1,4-beta-xylosidase
MSGREARADFQTRLGRRSDEAAEQRRDGGLAPPERVTAESGVGHVTLRWSPVDGAVGYLVQRAADSNGALQPVDHGGRDVLAVPGHHYADTTGRSGTTYRYAVSALPDVERGPGHPSATVSGRPLPVSGAPPVIEVVVRGDQPAGTLRRLWHMIGSERLSQLLVDERTGERDVAAEFAAALRLAHAELGVERVRAHAILHDDLAVYDEHGGAPVYDFSRVAAVYDRVLETGLRPVVELSFMPRALARDPRATVFDYGAIISPPHDWRRWAQLVERLARFLVQRYGADEVARWGFEVWNEPNLEVFWSGTQGDYLELYAASARAVKAADDRLLIGGPATAAAGWLAHFLDAVDERDLPLDFVSTHTYGNVPLDVRAAVAARQMPAAVWWTEWGVTPTHFAAVTDSAFGAPFVLHGMKAAQRTADAVAYWVVSDHFEELGRPDRLWHGGFGLLAVGNLRKARWWALALAEQLADDLCSVTLTGDGAGSLVDAWASTAPDGRVDLLVWNGTLQQDGDHSDGRLDRWLDVRVEGLGSRRYRVRIARVDQAHSNIAATVQVAQWPSPEQWRQLHAADRLWEEDLGVLVAEAGALHLSLALPMPGVARLRLEPTGRHDRQGTPAAT